MNLYHGTLTRDISFSRILYSARIAILFNNRLFTVIDAIVLQVFCEVLCTLLIDNGSKKGFALLRRTTGYTTPSFTFTFTCGMCHLCLMCVRMQLCA